MKSDPEILDLIPRDTAACRHLRRKVAAGTLRLTRAGNAWHISGAGVKLRVANLSWLTPGDLEPVA
ncbi:MAG: hypothetical protein Q8L39_10630 [Burkholderiales bacterium]|nr:hypothetical protein [Burkholderiales bacterium]